ncbi:uncharacterized protein BDR25DRAFT_351918 [Lindgomyces ingoldianus]|uniref:Uncharacterized protein n=1 Tax=Lindgomyces ingoldianus TaxID=673940 RepID=A0ACB6R4Y8_9PLEO|nr:uncharacterized protein BDR25DRAFT_351918 [Lindgomyces ingoldianus]KAF2474379.1 hypothetical protein BDR25DRAFT_351918 [Lindgomyces ingoldianus]
MGWEPTVQGPPFQLFKPAVKKSTSSQLQLTIPHPVKEEWQCQGIQERVDGGTRTLAKLTANMHWPLSTQRCTANQAGPRTPGERGDGPVSPACSLRTPADGWARSIRAVAAVRALLLRHNHFSNASMLFTATPPGTRPIIKAKQGGRLKRNRPHPANEDSQATPL